MNITQFYTTDEEGEFLSVVTVTMDFRHNAFYSFILFWKETNTSFAERRQIMEITPEQPAINTPIPKMYISSTESS